VAAGQDGITALVIPETRKKPGVFYAESADGIELPIVDLTHPSFALPVDRAEATALIERYARAEARRGRLQQWARRPFYGYFLKRSVLGRALMGAAGTFLPGMPTYLLKLGPDHLGAGYAQEIDRRIAASPPALAMRLRLLDVVALLVEGLVPALARPAAEPLHLVDIGGGPASDSLNALILLRKEHPALIEGRAVRIHVLDRDDRGPLFGARALEALRGEGGPLRGLDVSLEHVRYDWTDTMVLDATLAAIARAGGIVACSSEGALFDYGSDEEIRANLASIRRGSPAGAIVVGTVTRARRAARPGTRREKSRHRVAVIPRTPEEFETLVGSAGWRVEKRLETPLQFHVRLV
jgi:hypothetical protein